MIEQIVTIGAYGYNADRFIRALRDAGVDLFIDVRARRGVRGSEYAFANAKRLQAALAEAGIGYVHVVELAPPKEIRQAQYRVDEAQGVAKRTRAALSDQFVHSYEKACLAGFDPAHFVASVCGPARRPALFCVEREADACHRSLVAKRLRDQLSVPVLNLSP